MKFYSVMDSSGKETRIIGVILESESGAIAGAAIEGSLDEPTSPCRIIYDVSREPITITVPRGQDRVRVSIQPGEVGFTEAVLSALRPPLSPGPRGIVTRIGSPRDMLQRTWQALATSLPMPSVVSL